MENERLSVNLERLQNQVKTELLAEEKYLRENSAKLRAVEQRVPTYEDFRQMVLASHLKPLDKGESLRDNSNSQANSKVWNSIAAVNSIQDTSSYSSISSSSSESRQQPTSENDLSSNVSLVDTVPKTNLEFRNVWRRLDEFVDRNDLRWRFLQNLNCQRIKELFHVEINGDQMGEMLLLFEWKLNSLRDDDDDEKANEKSTFDFILQLLNIFTKCNRFNLNLMFLKTNQVESCKRVFEYLEDKKVNVKDLKIMYIK
jgi:hypothetical protein